MRNPDKPSIDKKTTEIERAKAQSIFRDIDDVASLDQAYKSHKALLDFNMNLSGLGMKHGKKMLFLEGALTAFCTVVSVIDFSTTGGMATGGFMAGLSIVNAANTKATYNKYKKEKKASESQTSRMKELDKAYAERKEAILNPPPPPPPDALIKLLTAGNDFDEAAQKQEPAAEPKKPRKPKPPSIS